MQNAFPAGEATWVARLGSLRNTVRQELVARQLAEHVVPGSSVLDVGCGQGTQALRLARRGCAVLGADPSPDLLEQFRAGARLLGVRVETVQVDLAGLAAVVGGRTFEVVCAHGLLMYLDDLPAALTALAARVGPEGLLSVTFRNGGALAFRPGMRRQWRAALAAFDADTYVNELGVEARAHRLPTVLDALAGLGLDLRAWYGVRLFTDPMDADEGVDEEAAADLLEVELEAGRRDPYRLLASQLHVIAARRP